MHKKLLQSALLILLAPVIVFCGTASGGSPIKPHAPSVLSTSVITDPSPVCETNNDCSDLFGTSAAVDDSGTQAVVGAPKWISNPTPTCNICGCGNVICGTAWLFHQQERNWINTGQLVVSDELKKSYTYVGAETVMSRDGSTIALSTTAVGTGFCADLGLPNLVLVYSKPADGWTGLISPSARIWDTTPSTIQCSATDNFGESLAISDDGSAIVVGGFGGSQALVFERPDGGWGANPNPAVTARLGEEEPFDPNWFSYGSNVAISGDGATIAASSQFVGSTYPMKSDVVAIFHRPNEGWGHSEIHAHPDQLIQNPNPLMDSFVACSNGSCQTNGPTFGSGIALDKTGSTLAVVDPKRCRYLPTGEYCDIPGSPWVPGYSGSALSQTPVSTTENADTGATYVFARTADGFRETADLVASSGQYYDMMLTGLGSKGFSLAISSDGTSVLVGLAGRSPLGVVGYGTGAAVQYGLAPDGTWQQTDEIDPSSLNEDGDLGVSVALPANSPTAFVTAPYFGSRAGTLAQLRRTPNTSVLHGQASQLIRRKHGKVFSYLSLAAPHLLSVSPKVGIPGQPITLRGNNLLNAFVALGSANLNVVTRSDTSLQVKLPADAASGPLAVSSSIGGVGSSLNYKVVLAKLTSISPLRGAVGARITLRGTNLLTIQRVTFTGANKPAPVVVKTATRVVVKVPPKATTGPLHLWTMNYAQEVLTGTFTVMK